MSNRSEAAVQSGLDQRLQTLGDADLVKMSSLREEGGVFNNSFPNTFQKRIGSAPVEGSNAVKSRPEQIGT